MNDKEQVYARELLNALSEKDIIELSNTVTKGKFKPQFKQDGLELILRYEADVRSLLSRKKISANLLAQYLHCKQVAFSVDSNKLTLCDTVIKFWNHHTSNAETQICETTPQTFDNVAVPSRDTALNGSARNEVMQLSETDVIKLGVEFVEWFYSQLRGPNLELRELGSEHFFADASCRVHFGCDVEEGVGSEGCARVIAGCLSRAGRAVPVANPGGVKSQVSPHGAVKVLACGTLHSPPSSMIGPFEQAFLLVRDPTALDNWKIKYTELHLNLSTQVPAAISM